MGFATVAAFCILATFALTAAGLYADAMLRAGREVAAAGQDQLDHALAVRSGAIALHNRTWSPGTLELRVNNTGGQSFDANATEVLLEGLHATASIKARQVEGLATRVWAPGEQLYLRLEGLGPTEPGRAWVVAETGVSGVG